MAGYSEADVHDEVMALMTSPISSDRVAALNQIATFGENWAVNFGYIDKAAEMLDDAEVAVQIAALHTLGNMGKYGATHAGEIASKMKSSKEKDVKKAAIQAFSGFGQNAESHISALVEMVDNADLDLVVEACMSLGSMKATAAAGKLKEKLDNKDVDIVVAACAGLGDMNAEDAAIAKLLSHKEARVRATATLALAKNVAAAEKNMNQAPKLLADPDGEVKIAAMNMVATLGEKAASLAPAIGELLKNENVGVKTLAAAALGGIGEKAESEIDALVPLLAETSEDTSTLMLSVAGVQAKAPSNLRKPACAAAASLPMMGPKGKKQAIKVAKGLNSPDFEIRVECILALGKMEMEGAKYEDQLISCIEDAHPLVVEAACKALGFIADYTKMVTSSAAEKVASCVKDSHPAVRAAALESLSRMNEEAATYVEDIIKSFSDIVASVRIQAINAIQACGELGQMYTADIVRLMFDQDVNVRLAAIQAVPKMGERGAAFAEEVTSLLEDPDVTVRAACLKCLGQFGPEVALPFHPLIMQVAEDSDRFPELAEVARQLSAALKSIDS